MESTNHFSELTEVGFNYEYTQKALDVVKGKWKAAIIWNIRFCPMGFNELLRSIPSISHKVLTQQLRQLENDCIIQRKVQDVPLNKVEYAITEYGKSLFLVFAVLEMWGKEYMMRENIKYTFSIDPSSCIDKCSPPSSYRLQGTFIDPSRNVGVEVRISDSMVEYL